MNRYELVFADTGAYPYPPGITTGNFRPYDVGDIDGDSLTDLVGPNVERRDSTFYLVTTQESPNYTYYPSFLSWWFRTSNSAPGYTYYFTSDLDHDEKKEILTFVKTDSIRLTLIENVSNNQNIPVWRRFTYGPSYAFGDFDQDSLRDFVTANLGSSGEIYFFENTGNDQYERFCIDTVYLPNGTDVFSGQDLDGDGKPEFFVAFYSYGTGAFYLYMWEAIGNNTYQRTLVDQKTITVSYSTERKSECGDLDGDGIEELVWTTPTRLFVYKATGNNQFQQVWQWNNDHGGQIPSTKVNISDMNNNGYNEIVVSGNNKTSILELEAVRLLRPNGGENFSPNSQQLIRWQTFYPPRCDSLFLFYSIDNGRTYIPIASGISGSDTSYLWTVPNVSSDSCKVRIIAYGPGWQYDESDAVFRIATTGIDEHYPLDAKRTTLIVSPNPAKFKISIRYTL
ncbi:MAG: VCBS repeat-containing protein, partial [candidate division WOR-3 bacterium]|nr:VCBS repeat-containing protein [candidate division WOR-3 bacterium]